MTVHKTLVVYLAGGTRSGWGNRVKEAVKGPIYLDPSQHGLKEEQDYTDWDLTAVDMADVLFCYLEKDNPSGAGLAVEVGYAAAKGKPIIYIEDEGFPYSRYFGMVRRCATAVFSGQDEFDEALQELRMHWTDSRRHLCKA